MRFAHILVSLPGIPTEEIKKSTYNAVIFLELLMIQIKERDDCSTLSIDMYVQI